MFEHLGYLSPQQYDLCNIEHSGGMVPFICYYRKVRSSICISQKPYNGKRKLHWTYAIKKQTNKKKTGSLSPPSAVISPFCGPRWEIKKRFVCFSIDWLLSGRMNCTGHKWFRAHQNTNECRSLLRKHNSKEGIPGPAWLRPHRSEGTCNPNLGQSWRNQKHQYRQMRSDCGSHVNWRPSNHSFCQHFLPAL